MSMKCPECGAKSTCIDSRPEKSSITKRRYHCVKKDTCGNRWSTVEVLSTKFSVDLMDRQLSKTHTLADKLIELLKETMDKA